MVAKSFYVCCQRACTRRSLDSTRITAYLRQNGYESVRSPRDAGIVVVYTCGCFRKAEGMTLRTIEKVRRQKRSDAALIVTGCLTKIHPEALDGDYRVCQPEALGALDDIIGAQIPFASVPDQNIIRDVHPFVSIPLRKQIHDHFQFTVSAFVRAVQVLKRSLHYSDRYSNVYLIKVAEGCVSKCSYCVIRKAGGPLHSKPLEAVVEEFARGLKEGYRDFALIPHDLGCYGIDIDTNIVELLARLFAMEGEYRIELPDVNPRWLVKYYSEFLALLRQHRAHVSRIVMPIQSGSDRILQAMNRKYVAADVVACIKGLREAIPDLPIETHIMIGFPGETEEDFLHSCRLVRDMGITSVVLYDYEDMYGTESAAMPNKVSPEEIFRRKRCLQRQIGYNVWS